MKRTFRYPLHPTAAQAAVIETWLGMCCDLYNAALQERRDAWVKQRVSIGYNNQSASLTEIRASDAAAASVSVEAQRSALRRVDRAFRDFFCRCKKGSTPGFPRFRSRCRYNSFAVGRVLPQGDRLRIPKLGLLKFRPYRPLCGRVLETTIRRDATGRWWVCFACDVGAAPARAPVRSLVGVDVGLEAFATLSDGTRIDNPRFFKSARAKLADRQRAVERKRNGSKARQRARLSVARAHQKIKNQRLDFARKLSAGLFARYDLVAFEDLNIKGLATGMLAKSVKDAAWGVFIRALTLKAESAGKWAVPVDPRGTSQRCPQCGAVKRKELSEREHRCDCGCVMHRDHAAALNIKALGVSAVEAA
jgi:putative transposase